MADPGLTEDGLVTATTTEIRDDLSAALKNQFGASFNTGDQSAAGILAGIFADRLGSVWAAIDAVYSSQDADAATGASLDALCLLTGTFRRPASSSAVSLTLTGTATTVVPAASLARTASTDVAWFTTEDATLVAATAWDIGTTYGIGDRVKNDNSVWQCRTAGIAGEPTGTPAYPGYSSDLSTATWYWLGAGDAVADVDALATNTGPVVGAAGDIIVIDAALGGWDGVLNLLDATPGADEQTDESLRLDRIAELSNPGTSTVDAIRADLLNRVSDVTSATVFENNTDVTDADGVPPHSVECLVRGGVDQAIYNQLLASVAAGIRTHGTSTGSATDTQGTAHVMKFSRPTEVPIYVDLLLVVSSATFPANGDVQVQEAITSWGEDVTERGGGVIGRDAIRDQILAQVWQVPGVIRVTHCYIDDVLIVGTPVADITINNRSLATYDSSRISVATTTGTP